MPHHDVGPEVRQRRGQRRQLLLGEHLLVAGDAEEQPRRLRIAPLRHSSQHRQQWGQTGASGDEPPRPKSVLRQSEVAIRTRHGQHIAKSSPNAQVLRHDAPGQQPDVELQLAVPVRHVGRRIGAPRRWIVAGNHHPHELPGLEVRRGRAALPRPQREPQMHDPRGDPLQPGDLGIVPGGRSGDDLGAAIGQLDAATSPGKAAAQQDSALILRHFDHGGIVVAHLHPSPAQHGRAGPATAGLAGRLQH